MYETFSLSQSTVTHHTSTYNHYATYLLHTVDTNAIPKGVRSYKPLYTGTVLQATSKMTVIVRKIW